MLGRYGLVILIRIDSKAFLSLLRTRPMHLHMVKSGIIWTVDMTIYIV